jgi:hypothetical protein
MDNLLSSKPRRKVGVGLRLRREPMIAFSSSGFSAQKGKFLLLPFCSLQSGNLRRQKVRSDALPSARGRAEFLRLRPPAEQDNT